MSILFGSMFLTSQGTQNKKNPIKETKTTSAIERPQINKLSK